MTRIAVLLTVFNRKDVTLYGLSTLKKAIDYLGEGYFFDIYLTDDGCTDGTADAVKQQYPNIIILKGNGNLYWNGGMRKAWQAANIKDYDFYIWFNDDVDLYEDSLETILSSYYKSKKMSLISGAFCNLYGNVSYGGWIQGNLAAPSDTIRPVELINGNLVLVPKIVFQKIGILEGCFIHSFGDWEYGLRARRHKVGLYITYKYVGICNRHDEIRNFYNPKNNFFHRIKEMYSSKNVFFRDFIVYGYKTHGILGAAKNFASANMRCMFPKFWIR